MNLCSSQYRARPDFTSVQSDQTLLTLSSHLDMPINDNGQNQKWKLNFGKGICDYGAG